MHNITRQLIQQRDEENIIDNVLYAEFLDVQHQLFDQMLILFEFTVISRNQFDPTTKLMNRRSVDTILAHEKHRMERSEQADCCLVIADIDNFKLFNDTYGHDVGDQVLEHVATIFHQSIRRHDSVARFGGEEFLFVLPDMSLEDASKTIDRVRMKLASSYITSRGEKLSVTASFGVTQLCRLCDIKETVKRADMALYEAKHRGRDCTVVVDTAKLVDEFSQEATIGHLTEEQIKKYSKVV
jgi:diguanylate cyclase (GGDEF)-like protein